MYLEDISESWKAETSGKIKGTLSQDTSKRALYTRGTKRAGAVWDAHSGAGSRNKVGLYLLGHVF